MSVRLGMLLCLSGIAGCSHETTASAHDPSYVSEPSAPASEPALQPASLEDSTVASPPKQAPRPQPAPDTIGTGPKDEAPKAAAPEAKPDEAKPDDTKADNTKADNTKRNERDRSSAALTPMDQGGGQTDLKITQQIRQAVMADKSLSFTAKNVKIITSNGKVTLRGPVNSEQERSAIEAAARKVAGTTQVDNQLEVKK